MLNVITHTNDRLLRAISFLTVAQITRDGIHKFTFTSDDSEAEVVPLMTPKRIFLYIFRFNTALPVLQISEVQGTQNIWIEERPHFERNLCPWST